MMVETAVMLRRGSLSEMKGRKGSGIGQGNEADCFLFACKKQGLDESTCWISAPRSENLPTLQNASYHKALSNQYWPAQSWSWSGY